MSILDGLNESQLEAVRTVEGPLLILAGAGSGKTRVLTRRIAFLAAEQNVLVDRILAMTFTNKAAGEMRERVEDLLERSCRGMWIGTFHSLCARILRSEAESVGLQQNFSIYDTTDQMALLRRVVRDQEMSEKQYPPRQIRARISREKNRMVDVAMFSQRASTYYEQEIARVYRQYQDALRQNNAVDFDDLLVTTVRLFQNHPEVLEKYQNQFDYLLIDEYQDTNRPQYLFAQYLAEKHKNICVVGDDDQSIYAWRGADLRNILDFEQDYPSTKVIRLEQNYRSTQIILEASNAVIRHNLGRKGKELWTERVSGDPIRLKRCQDEREEARWVSGAMQDLKQSGKYRYQNMGVLYRTNAQSRALEDGMRRAGIPYDIVGDVRFYERKEVKDILAYLKLVANPRDSVSFSRIINTPRRGIGDTSVSRLDDFAMREGLSPYAALAHLEAVETIPARAKKMMATFYEMVEAFRAEMGQLRADQLAEKIVSETGYLEEVNKLAPGEAESRRNHIQELLTDMEVFVEQSEDVSLEAYLRNVSLVTDVDQWAADADRVTLMTLHSAKGLEFPLVFICGLEDGLFPIIRPGEDGVAEEEAMEEERRLFYVGITRAQDRLFLSYAALRRRYGGTSSSSVSRFVGEIPEDLIDSEFRISEITPSRERKKTKPRPVLLPSGDAFPMERGTWVYHPAWGRGQIQNRSGTGQNTKLQIRFEGGETKTVVVKFANLQSG
ncbi:MAG: UvrD-helicase domain-containing protein [bacterium]|nr:UvrD-helicase domain-containing protein [bacterium]